MLLTIRGSLILVWFIVSFNQLSYGQDSIPERISLKSALAQIPSSNGDLYTQLITHSSIDVYLYTPQTQDDQKPHDRDEIYIVLEGNGTLIKSGKKLLFEKGDILFVKAGIDHHFEGISADFKTYVVFFGSAKHR